MGKSTFAKRLNAIIKEQNIRQIDLCKKTGIGKSAMSQYLRGSFAPKQQKLCELAAALNVSEAWLMGFDVPRERKVDSFSETGESDTFYFAARDNGMKEACIPRGAMVLLDRIADSSNADSIPYKAGQVVCYSYKGSPDTLRMLYRKDDTFILMAAASDAGLYPPIICKLSDLADGTLQIKGIASKVVINL